MPRRHVYVTQAALAVLEELQALTGKSLSGAVMDAARFYRWSLVVRAQGGKLVVERDGKTREVVTF